MASDFEAVVSKAAEDAGLDPAFVTRLVKAESNWNPSVVSPKGAVGLMQIMPETGKRYGVTNLTDPTQNVRAGIAYLSDLQKKYPGRPDLMAAAYNAGEGAVDKAGGVPKFAETQGYVEKVDPFAKYATPATPAAPVAAAKEEDPFAKYVGATPPPTAAQMLANVPIDEAGNPLKPTKPGQPTGDFWQNIGSELRGFTRGELPAGWKGSLREQLESAAHPQTAGTLVGLTVPGAPEVSGAIRGGLDALPTIATAAGGYALGGVHGAIGAVMGKGLLGRLPGLAKAALEGYREAAGEAAPIVAKVAAGPSPMAQIRGAAEGLSLTMDAKWLPQALNRVAAGEDAAKVVKELSGKSAAYASEIEAGRTAAPTSSLPAHLTPKDVIPLPESVPRLQTVVEGLPQIAPPPPPNVAPPIAPASIPAAWKPYAGQTELGQVLPAQPPGRTMSGAPQASRPFVPPATRPPQSPAGAVNMAMKETGVRIPARVMDAAIRRVKAGEDAVDVVKSYAEAAK